MSATPAESGASSAGRSGLASTRNSSSSIATDWIAERAMAGTSAARASGPSVEARIRPCAPKAISLPVRLLNSAASRSSRNTPTVRRPRISGSSPSSRTGTLTSCRTPRPCGVNIEMFRTDFGSCAAAGMAVVSAPAAPSTAPFRPVSTSKSAFTSTRYSSASGWTVGASPVATAALSFGRSATTRARRVK